MKTGGNPDERVARIMFEQTGGPDGVASLCCAQTARCTPDRRSLVVVSPVPGPRPSMAMTMSGFPIFPLRKARSWNFAASALRPAHAASRPATKSHRPAVMSEVACRCRPTLRSARQAMCGVMNNWQDINSCFGVPPEPLSTRCGGQGVTIFFGMAETGAPTADRAGGRARRAMRLDSRPRLSCRLMRSMCGYVTATPSAVGPWISFDRGGVGGCAAAASSWLTIGGSPGQRLSLQAHRRTR